MPSDEVTHPIDGHVGRRWIGGGISSLHPLDGTPFTIRVSLNDWMRFTRPGMYTLQVESQRLVTRSYSSISTMRAPPVRFTIADTDAAWQARQLREALALIGRGDPRSVERGATTLRYLATEPAGLAAAEVFDTVLDVSPWAATAMLVSSPYRASVVSRMETRLDTDGTRSTEFVQLLAKLRALAEDPAWAASGEVRREHEDVLRDAYTARARRTRQRVLPLRRWLTTEFAELGGATTDARRQDIASTLQTQEAEAAAAFGELKPALQLSLLENPLSWAVLRAPWMTPALMRLAGALPAEATNPDTRVDVALRRLYELQPTDARAIFLEEMRTGERRVSYETLATLPDAMLGDLDSTLLSRYARGDRDDWRTLETRATAAWLISRYSSDALRPQVQAWLREPLPCADEAAAIAYLAKRREGTVLERVNQNRVGQPGCVDPLSALSDRYWDDQVELAAIARLEDQDQARAAVGAQALGSHGSVRTKTILLVRLERLASQRAVELAPSRDGSRLPPPADRLENALVDALFGNRNSALDATDIARMRAACAAETCRTNVDVRARSNESR